MHTAEFLPLLRKRLTDASLKVARLRGVRDADQRQLAEWTDKVAKAKARLGLADEISRIFVAMQNRAHSRAVGTFERLLSAVLQDVIPGKGNVRLELTTSNNAPNLDIFVENNGALEDVLEGNGGAVTNVISAGLRFAALTRTKNRRLMILDEPDCWVKPARVPNLIRVIADVAHTTKTQTFLISHHDPAYFRGRVNILELVRNKDTGLVEAAPCEPLLEEWESPQQPGIRSIRLVNVRAHADTTLTFGPGVTALIGDNDLGKSTALVTATKAVGYNESDDTVIRHGAKEAQITFELENDRRLVWTRRAKASPKVVYSLYQGTKLLAEGKAPGRGSVPDWVTAELGISQVDDLDIQVGSQKNPVFLLDEKASRRAQLLSVGRESGHLTAIMNMWGSIKRADSATETEGEARITRLSHRLEKLEGLDTVSEKLETLTEQFSPLEAMTLRAATLTRLTKTIKECGAGVAHMTKELAVLDALPADLPVLQDAARPRVLAARIRRNLPFKNVSLPDFQVSLPQLVDSAVVKRTAARIHNLRKYEPLFSQQLPELPELPVLTDNKQLTQTLIRLRTLTEQVRSTERELLTAETDYTNGQQAFKKLQADLGGVCPLCDHHFGETTHVHAQLE